MKYSTRIRLMKYPQGYILIDEAIENYFNGWIKELINTLQRFGAIDFVGIFN